MSCSSFSIGERRHFTWIARVVTIKFRPISHGSSKGLLLKNDGEVMIAEPIEPIEIFICYAREDEEYRLNLEKQLRILKRQGLITIWHDREIVPGTEWQSEIDKHLKSAQIILLLVSPDFMDSDYCYGIEMQNAMVRHQRGEAYVIPIIVHHVYWQEAPFGKLQVLPTDARPITDYSWHSLNEAFFNVVVGIREVIKKVREEQLRQVEEERLRKLREEQLRQVEEERLRKLREEEWLHKQVERMRKLKEEELRQAEEEQIRSSLNYYPQTPFKNNNLISTNNASSVDLIAKKSRELITIESMAFGGRIGMFVEIFVIIISIILSWGWTFFIYITILFFITLIFYLYCQNRYDGLELELSKLEQSNESVRNP